MEDTDELKAAYATYGGDHFEIVGIAFDEPRTLKDYLTSEQVIWPQLIQTEEDFSLIKRFAIAQYPTLYLVDPSGAIVAQGHVLRGGRLLPTLAQYLEQKNGP